MRRKAVLTFLITTIISSHTLSQGVWEQMLPPGPTTNQMVSVHFMDEWNGISVGEQGTILKTEDGGETWRIIEIPWLAYLLDVHFPSTDVGYIVGQNGIILKTDDAGETWSLQNSGFTNNLHRVRFQNENEGWIIGETGLILYTDNGGEDWQQQVSETSEDFRGISLIGDEKVCIAGTGEILLLTDNGGQSWNPVTIQGLNSNYTYHFNDVFFMDDSTGWIGGEIEDNQKGVLLTTNDSGKIWTKFNINSVTYPLGSLIISHDDLFWGVNQIHFINENKGVFITGKSDGYHNHSLPLYTSNGGEDWKGTRKSFNWWESYIQPCRLFPLNDSKLILTGYGGEFRYSDDNGKSWYLPNRRCRDIREIAVGINGKIFGRQVYIEDVQESYPDSWTRSTNYGRTWTSITPQLFDENNNAVYFKSFPRTPMNIDDKLWTLYYPNGFWNPGQIYRSDDWGQTWYWQSDSVHSDLYKAIFLSQDTLLFYDLVQKGSEPDTWSALEIVFSYDRGKRIEAYTFDELWSDISQDPDDYDFISNCFFFNSQFGFLIGTQGNILKTENTGKSWESLNSGVADHLWDITFLDRSTGFVVGNFGRILKTKDGGETWFKTESGTQDHIFSIAFKDEQNGWVGTESGLRYTSDGGETWQSASMRYHQGFITNLYFDEEDVGYAFTHIGYNIQVPIYNGYSYPRSYNALFCWKEGGVFIDEDIQSVVVAEDFILEQNYPNPFNGYTTIAYRLMKNSTIELNIYSIQGRLIRQLELCEKFAGNYAVVWDGISEEGIHVATGVYIYQLKSARKVKSGKMLYFK